jgi:hypothetical protein
LAEENHRIWLRFSDGTQGEIDLSDLAGKSVEDIFPSLETGTKVAGMALARRSVRLSTKQSNELSKIRRSFGECEEKRGAQSSIGFLTPFIPRRRR